MKVYEVLRLLAVVLAAVVLLRDMVGPKHRKVLGLTLVFVATGMAMSLLTTKDASAPVAVTAEAPPTLVGGERFTITQAYERPRGLYQWGFVAQDGSGQRWIDFSSTQPLALGLRIVVAYPLSPISLDPHWCLLQGADRRVNLTTIEGKRSTVTTLRGVAVLVDKGPLVR